jgi:hypothetical protein
VKIFFLFQFVKKTMEVPRNPLSVEPDSTTLLNLHSYMDYVEVCDKNRGENCFCFQNYLQELPHDVQRCITEFREHDSKLLRTLQLLQLVSRLLLAEDASDRSPRKELLMEKLEQMSLEILNINEYKLNCAMKINHLIANKYREYIQRQQLPRELSPVSGGFTPTVTSSAETKVPKKRGRKPKKETASNCDLMMLAVLAVKQEQESKAATKTFGKLPVSTMKLQMTFLPRLCSESRRSQSTRRRFSAEDARAKPQKTTLHPKKPTCSQKMLKITSLSTASATDQASEIWSNALMMRVQLSGSTSPACN